MSSPHWWQLDAEGRRLPEPRATAWAVESADGHRVVVREPEHAPKGDPCSLCQLPAARHRKRPRRGRTARDKTRRRARYQERRRELRRSHELTIGIDGEGQGKEPHIYTYMAAVREDGEKLGSVEDPEGLSSVACLSFLLSLGAKRVFGFSLGYDLTMWLRDLPDEVLYRLVRPEKRARMLPGGQVIHRPEYWRGFKLNYMRRKFTVQRVRWDPTANKYRGEGHTVTVWDVFAFYQGKFTKAIADWKIAPGEIIAEIARMKDQRENFDRMSRTEIQKYCDDECKLLALLVRQLIDAHDAVDLPLKNFYGAGSTGSALLDRMGVREYKADPPDEMVRACAQGFVGGRFELSRCGPVEEECWGHDISSAYPYQMARLPCLTHGRWKLVTGPDLEKQIRGARLALVHCEVRRSGPSSWGPLPWRAEDGTILFPLRCDGTWVWKDEYLAAVETLWPGVTARAAWVYTTKCGCLPFAEVPSVYVERCKLGKDAAGLTLKLGINSGYGKTAQSIGAAPFRSWVWAGNITSGTRAQLLRAIAAAKDPRSVLMLATDGVLATEKLKLDEPEETGTAATGKPLGGWEVKGAPRGVFLCRPGIYFPLHATIDELKEVRARGISRSVLFGHSDHIVSHFRRYGWQRPYKVKGCRRFVGLKQGIGRKEGEAHRHKNFGEWVDYPIEVTFDPAPKRAEVRRDLSLTCWERMPGETEPYDRAKGGVDAKAMRRLNKVLEDAPDGDIVMG